MYRGDYRIRSVPEVVARSGAALLHFFSDDAYNMSGFNVTYRLDACPSAFSASECSGHGVCIEGACTCDAAWTGEACDARKCPDGCGSSDGRGRCDVGGCACASEWRGAACEQRASLGWWERVRPRGAFRPPGAAGLGAAVWRDSLYAVAGESYGRGQLLYAYDLNGRIWETPHDSPHHGGGVQPAARYAHSTVLYGDKLFVYGGVVLGGGSAGGAGGPTAELWAYDIGARNWENVTVRRDRPLRVAGHSATLVRGGPGAGGGASADRMVVIFGHSTEYGYLNAVQELHLGTREWRVVRARGHPVKGGYGHSAAWDELTRRIYVYGGVVSESESTQVLSARLYAYEPDSRVWTLLANASSARFLHAAAFVSPGVMLALGGNTHNDTSHSDGAKCYSADVLAYDAACGRWLPLAQRPPADIEARLARYGHAAVTFEGALYVYGGFDGQMLSDMVRYVPGECGSLRERSSCLGRLPGRKCAWRAGLCVEVGTGGPGGGGAAPPSAEAELCEPPAAGEERARAAECAALRDCASCVSTWRACSWCAAERECRPGAVAATVRCRDGRAARRRVDDCVGEQDGGGGGDAVTDATCRQLHTCPACGTQPHCRWDYETRCRARGPPDNVTASLLAATEQPSTASEPATCSRTCSEFTSCANCTQEECIWCQNEGRCVDKNAYTASFPYGQCREWTTVGARCRTRKGGAGISAGTASSPTSTDTSSQCSFFSTCAQCRAEPACGWCDDGSRTGLGKCLAGGSGGPAPRQRQCNSEQWHFTTCPACQCNGHATCTVNSSVCGECNSSATGDHCERCAPGTWGSPVNGGDCVPCECNGQARLCHSETGKCHCTTKGLAGDRCEKCDATNHYHGDPANHGSCYYDLTIDYQFTFNLSKKEDRHFTQINFRNSPIKPDVDADFSITCSVTAKMNITIKKGQGPEQAIIADHNCTTFRSRFTKAEYSFGMEDNVTLTTFYVYVYDFQPPLWIQISFSQYPKLNLQQFFITFST